MKINTTALTGRALDWAVCKCRNKWPTENYGVGEAQDWSIMGPIIERECIDLECDEYLNDNSRWQACMVYEAVGFDCVGPTPLIAAARCYVASKLGDEVDIPEKLL